MKTTMKPVSLFLVLVMTISLLLPMANQADASSDGQINIQYLGHATFMITGPDGKTILTDPAGHGFASLDGLPTPTMATVSHTHMDHFAWDNPPAETVIIHGTGPEGFAEVPEANQSVVSLVYSHHFWSNDGLYSPNGIFVYDLNGIKIMHTGDMDGTLRAVQEDVYKEEYDSIINSWQGQVDVLLANISPGGDLLVTNETIANFVYELQPKVVIPMHLAFDDKRADFRLAMANKGIETASPPFKDGNSVTFDELSLPAKTTIWELDPGPYSAIAPAPGQPSVADKVYANGSPIDDVTVDVMFDSNTKLANIQLKKNNSLDLSAYNNDTEFTIKVNNNGYIPHLVLGAGNIQGWSDAGGVTTIKVKGVHFKPDTNTDVPLAVALAIQYNPDAQAIPANYRGMHISTNGNQFQAPYKDQETQKFGMMVGGVDGVKDGFFKAFLPDDLLSSWGVNSTEQLQAFIGDANGDNRQRVSSPTVTDVDGGMIIKFDMAFSVHQVYISSQSAVNNNNGGHGGGGGGGSKTSTAVTDTSVVGGNDLQKQTTTTADGKTVETFTVRNSVKEQIAAARAEGKRSLDIKIETAAEQPADISAINVPKDILASAKDMSINVKTPQASIELPAALVNALADANTDLAINVERGSADNVRQELSGIPEAAGVEVLGTPAEINTDIKGTTVVTIPLAGVTIPTDPQEREQFLNSLRVFAIHSDGEKQVINGAIVYDDKGNPTDIKFEVDKFSTFAVIKVGKKSITLNIGNVSAKVNDTPYTLDAEPFINKKTNRTLVPLRFVSEALGAKVDWLVQSRQIKIEDGARQITLAVGSRQVLVDGVKSAMDCPPEVALHNRTFVPLRFVSETLGAKVDYNSQTREITITK